MTEISNNAPEQDRRQNSVSISLTEQQARKIDFHKQCLDQLTIERRTEQGTWKTIAKDVRLPYVDDEIFETPVHLEYRIRLTHKNGVREEYLLETSLR